MLVTAAGASVKGPHRKQNEDAWRIYHEQQMVVRAGRGFLFMVADGVGGTGAGRYASWHVVDALALFFNCPRDQFNPGRTLQAILNNCNERLNELAAEDKSYTMAATTLALLYVSPMTNKGYMVSIGDSGVFLNHAGQWHQLNKDHRNEAGKVTSHIGMGNKMQISFRPLRMEPGDVYLLCTDGVREEIDEPTLDRMIMQDKHPKTVVEEIVNQANENGGRDNSTAVIVRFGPCADLPSEDDEDDW